MGVFFQISKKKENKMNFHAKKFDQLNCAELYEILKSAKQ